MIIPFVQHVTYSFLQSRRKRKTLSIKSDTLFPVSLLQLTRYPFKYFIRSKVIGQKGTHRHGIDTLIKS